MTKILCLNFSPCLDKETLETLMLYSPRVQQIDSGEVFVDISSTHTLLGKDQEILLSLRQRYPDTPVALSASCAYAHLLAAHTSSHIPILGSFKNPQRFIHHWPLETLKDFFGLKPWPKDVSFIVQDLQLLGCHHYGDLQRLSLRDWRERWGHLGALIWQRLWLKESEIIAPLLSERPYLKIWHFDQPVEHQKPLLELFMRELLDLDLLRFEQVISRIEIYLTFEYSRTGEKIEIFPTLASVDSRFLSQILKLRLDRLFPLEERIQQVELALFVSHSPGQQMDLWKAAIQNAETEHSVHQLIAIGQEAGVRIGFGQILNHKLPECTLAILPQLAESHPGPVMAAPTLVLPHPQRIGAQRLKVLKWMSFEEIEHAWWSEEEHQHRGYFVVQNEQGEWLWVYQDKKTNELFLHGYFD